MSRASGIMIGRRGLVLAAVFILALVALIVVSERGPAEHADAAIGTTAGCSYVPDSGAFFNFKKACDAHDNCYINHWFDKVGCDWKFLQDMRSYCYKTYQWWQWQRGPCLKTAWTYYAGVSSVGWACYNKWIRC